MKEEVVQPHGDERFGMVLLVDDGGRFIPAVLEGLSECRVKVQSLDVLAFEVPGKVRGDHVGGVGTARELLPPPSLVPPVVQDMGHGQLEPLSLVSRVDRHDVRIAMAETTSPIEQIIISTMQIHPIMPHHIHNHWNAFLQPTFKKKILGGCFMTQDLKLFSSFYLLSCPSKHMLSLVLLNTNPTKKEKSNERPY